jgi:hypothetical protein
MADIDCKESATLHWARYDATKRTLQVDFRGKDGEKQSTYEYADFPEEIFAQFNAATSRGRFFAARIRPKYKGTKIWQRH